MHRNDNPNHEQDGRPSADGRSSGESLAVLHLRAGGLVMYDTHNHSAWLLSDVPVALATMC
jgi:hypothetical protein